MTWLAVPIGLILASIGAVTWAICQPRWWTILLAVAACLVTTIVLAYLTIIILAFRHG